MKEIRAITKNLFVNNTPISWQTTVDVWEGDNEATPFGNVRVYTNDGLLCLSVEDVVALLPILEEFIKEHSISEMTAASHNESTAM